MNKKECRLHVFTESLYNDIQESYLKNIKGNFVLYSLIFCPNTGEYRSKNPVFMVVLCKETNQLCSPLKISQSINAE